MSQIKEIKEALEYYADVENTSADHDRIWQYWDDGNPDEGQIAKKALSALEEWERRLESEELVEEVAKSLTSLVNPDDKTWDVEWFCDESCSYKVTKVWEKHIKNAKAAIKTVRGE